MNVKVEKITSIDTNIDINEITLLTKEQYKKNKDIIPFVAYNFAKEPDCNWWLRSPAGIGYVWYVNEMWWYNKEEMVSEPSNYIASIKYLVRPALKITIPKTSNIKRGDKIKIAGYEWTILSNKLALCDEIVGKTRFNEYRQNDKDEEAKVNKYEYSEIKIWLEKWFKENIDAK